MLRRPEIEQHFNTSYYKEVWYETLDPNQGNLVTKVPQESRSPHGMNSQCCTVGQAEYIFTCEY